MSSPEIQLAACYLLLGLLLTLSIAIPYYSARLRKQRLELEEKFGRELRRAVEEANEDYRKRASETLRKEMQRRNMLECLISKPRGTVVLMEGDLNEMAQEFYQRGILKMERIGGHLIGYSLP